MSAKCERLKKFLGHVKGQWNNIVRSDFVNTAPERILGMRLPNLTRLPTS